MSDEPTLLGVIEGLERHLERLRDDGETRVEVARATLDALARPSEAELSPKTALPGEVAPIRADFASLAEISAEIAVCRRCALCEKRNRVVPGEGNPNAPAVLFVGEGPGAEEDAQGRPFVGAAGRLLTKMIAAMGFRREEVFIANVVKCRPPGNRTPAPGEMAACLPFLRQQIRLIRPKTLVALGSTALKGLLPDEKAGITRLRGQWKTYEGVRLMPTFHPSYLLRNPSKKKDVWSDLKQVLEVLGREPPAGK